MAGKRHAAMGFEDPHCGVEQSKFTASTSRGAARALAPLYVNPEA
jgi:hypothetical protein